MPVPPPVEPLVSARYGTCKDCFLYIKHRRRHVLDLPHSFGKLRGQVNSLLAHWKVVNEDINRQSATRQINDSHIAAYNELNRILKYYQENIVNQYKKLVGLELGANGEGGNETPVHELAAASKGWENKFYTPTFYKLARLDKDIVKFRTDVTNLEKNITLEYVTSPINPEIVVIQSAEELTHVPSHQAVLNSLVDCLNGAGCKRIAIHGEPQVGKTNILRNLNNLLVTCPPGLEFDFVIWVNFPTHLPSAKDIITDIQEQILQRLDLAGQNSGRGKKGIISRALRGKSYLLLFDGFSSSIELEDIGISEEHEHGKVIIEAKDPHLPRNFKFHEEIQVEKLPLEDSRKLFDKIIADTTFCKENRDLGDLILKELGGLPGVIVSIAGQLKSNKRVQSWEGVKRRLEADIWDNNLIGLAKVKSAFDKAYSKLKENDQKCILYAALFPKEFKIPIDILVECWKAEEFLRCPARTFASARSEGDCVLNQLTELYLLERCSEHYVKMPINYRKLARGTPFPGEKNATSFVRSGLEIDGHLTDKEWKMARRVSLMRSQLEELPVRPKCEGISTLFLQLNPNLRIIRKPFFRRMKELRVLDLHGTGIKLLPPSISNLTGLRSLYLHNCCDLSKLPRKIVELKELEVLDIRGTSIPCLPKEISSLVSLSCLRFSVAPTACNPNPEPGFRIRWRPNYPTTGRRVIFPPGTTDQLSKIEEMTIVIIDGSSKDIEDQIRTEVGEFKNVKLDLIRCSSSQSQDQENLVQQKGEGRKLPNPSVPETPVQDPTKGIQSPQSHNERQSRSQPLDQGNLIQPLFWLRKIKTTLRRAVSKARQTKVPTVHLMQPSTEGINLLNPTPLHDPTTRIQPPRSGNEHTTSGTKNASGDNINDKEKEKCTAEITSASGSTFGASYGVGSGLGKRKSLSSSSRTNLVGNRRRGRAGGECRRERVVSGRGGNNGGGNPLGLDGLSFTIEAPVTEGRVRSYGLSRRYPIPANRKEAPHQPIHRSAAFTQPAAQRTNQNTNQAVAHQYTSPPTSPVYPHATQLWHLPTNQ